MKNDKSLRGTMTRSSNIKTLMIISGVLLVLSLIGLSISATKPAQVTQKTALISYTQNSQFDYTVYLKPSYLYGPTPEVTTTSVAQFPQNVVGDIPLPTVFCLRWSTLPGLPGYKLFWKTLEFGKRHWS